MSALAFWSYHRRLSLDAQRIKYPDSDGLDNSINPSRQRNQSVRTDSESSAIPPDDRRVSLEPQDSDSDDQQIEKKVEEAGKRKRRFSMDFLFAKKGKDKQKVKKTRSKSVSVPSDNDDPRVREFRYPGIHNADFASLYFF